MKKKRTKILLTGLFKEEVAIIEQAAVDYGTTVNNWILDILRDQLLLPEPLPGKIQDLDKGQLSLSVYLDSFITEEFSHQYPRKVPIVAWVKLVIRSKLIAARN